MPDPEKILILERSSRLCFCLHSDSQLRSCGPTEEEKERGVCESLILSVLGHFDRIVYFNVNVLRLVILIRTLAGVLCLMEKEDINILK